MTHRMQLVGIGLVVALAVSLSGCAGKVRVSGKMMCESHGGTYSAQTKQCAYPSQPPARSAMQICQAQGGQWDDVADMCSLDERSR